MQINKIIRNKKFLLILLVLNLIGIFTSAYTYLQHIEFYISQGELFIIPFFAVSFWLFFFAFLFILYLYLDLKIPLLFGGMSFIYVFVYGIGSFLFYPLYMIFVDGFSSYHTWNIFAHGFVGLQAFLFLYCLNKPKKSHFFALGIIFIFKNYLDLFKDGFLYFLDNNFPFMLKIFLYILIGSLQITAFYLLWKLDKRLK
ncbi:hypothetical protein HYU23_03315 [Candidatus Woesearchaeota archaeon]|nr:hypothetical protein [Candidatus Woesearchaeota archaeon]